MLHPLFSINQHLKCSDVGQDVGGRASHLVRSCVASLDFYVPMWLCFQKSFGLPGLCRDPVSFQGPEQEVARRHVVLDFFLFGREGSWQFLKGRRDIFRDFERASIGISAPQNGTNTSFSLAQLSVCLLLSPTTLSGVSTSSFSLLSNVGHTGWETAPVRP